MYTVFFECLSLLLYIVRTAASSTSAGSVASDVGGSRFSRRSPRFCSSSTAVVSTRRCARTQRETDLSRRSLRLSRRGTQSALTNHSRLKIQVSKNLVIFFCRWLKEVSIILFINKIDLLEEKVQQGKRLSMVMDKLEEDSPYRENFQKFSTYRGPSGIYFIYDINLYVFLSFSDFFSVWSTEREVEEFVSAFPSPANMTSSSTTSMTSEAAQKKKKKKESIESKMQTKGISIETIRTATFIKRLLLVRTQIQQYTKAQNTVVTL